MSETTPGGGAPRRVGDAARPRSMAERVRLLRRQGFVGRTAERTAFASALRGDHDAPRVLLLHGPGGIGKSALLRRLADDAEDLGHTVVWVHGEYVLASATEFTEAAASVWASDRPVLLVDGFEHCQVLEAWLREDLLPTVPEDTVVVVAGRRRPDPHWTLDPGWRRVTRAISLRPLKPLEATVLLNDRGVPDSLHAAVNRFADGHPLALCLAAEVAAEAAPAGDTIWEPSTDVIETLLKRMIDRVPSVAHEYGLRVCGHVQHVTIDLLRTGLDEPDALAVFDWLAALPYVEPGPHGLVAHEQVRAALDASFRWRDSGAYAELHVRLWRYLAECASTMPADAAAVAVSQHVYLYRYSAHELKDLFEDQPTAALYERQYTPDMRGEVLRLARENQGEEGARLVAHWLDRQPEAFFVYFRAGDLAPVAFFAWLRLETDDWGDDPALTPVREHLARTGGLGPGKHIGVARFAVPTPSDDNYQNEAAGVNLHAVHITSATLREQGSLAASFVVSANIEIVTPQLEWFDYRLLRPMPELGDGGWGVFVHDWREVPFAEHLERIVSRFGWTSAAGQDSPAPTSIPQQEFFEAVKQALLGWHDDEVIAANPLIRIYGDSDALRAAVVAAVDALREDPRCVKHQRVVHATYFDRRTTQEGAAARLGLPFGTYRRHLRTGVQQICDALWHRVRA